MNKRTNDSDPAVLDGLLNRDRRPADVIVRLRPEIERACRVLSPCCDGVTLRLDWEPPTEAQPGWIERAVIPRPCDAQRARKPTRDASPGPCAACLHRCLSTVSLGSGDYPPCCACILGNWRSWLPIRVEGRLCAVMSLASKSERGRNGHHLPTPSPRLSQRKFTHTLHLAALLVSGALGRAYESGGRPASRDQSAPQPAGAEFEPRQRPSAAMTDHSNLTSALTARMLRAIREEFGRPLTLKELAQRLRRNPAYLSNLFARDVGVPFKRYLTGFRLTKARELLPDPSLAVSEVASAVGYTTGERFRAAFKQANGTSPSAWRRCSSEAAR